MRGRTAFATAISGVLLLSAWGRDPSVGGPARSSTLETAHVATPVASAPDHVPPTIKIATVPGPPPTSVDVTWYNVYSHEIVPTVTHWVIQHQPTVVRLYDDLMALPPFPSGVAFSCLDSFGARYRLVFLHGSQKMLTADADPAGCQTVQLSKEKTLWSAPHTSTGPAFWSLFALTLKLSESQLIDAPPESSGG